MSVDIFPTLNLVIYWRNPMCEWTRRRGGLPGLLLTSTISSTITGIEHVDSKSIQNVGPRQLYFHPGTI